MSIADDIRAAADELDSITIDGRPGETSMTFKKMLRVMKYLESYEINGSIYGDSNGELWLHLNGQPSYGVHKNLKRLGFVESDYALGAYVYRPR